MRKTEPQDSCVWSRALALLVLLATGLSAQEQAADHQHDTTTATPAWTWTVDASAFAGLNYQRRPFTDVAAWESQNWFMATAGRTAGPGQVTLHAMASLEPLTLGRHVYIVGGRDLEPGGSPQLFQTGESFRGVPLLHYQHPHDLVMGLGATYRLPRGRAAYTFGADLVGSPTLGPTPFMHRPSAVNNPQVPLGHHQLDSTHVAAGVLRAGVVVSNWTFEGSVFRGEEPDEQRFAIDAPRLDSWAARIGWRGAAWEAQFSGGFLHAPEWYEPYDQKRFTASLSFSSTVASRPLAVTGAWGQTREYTPFRNVSHAWLLEWDLRATAALSTYGRAEVLRKEIFGVDIPHPPGFSHPHFLSDVVAVSLGAVRDLPFAPRRLGIGGDVTAYRMSQDLRPFFGGSTSFHVFLRWRHGGAAPVHVH